MPQKQILANSTHLVSIKTVLTLLIILNSQILTHSQNIGNYLGDESEFLAETKQVNQFFRRFNAEETLDGKRIYPGNAQYRSTKLRKQYINMLFDQQNSLIDESTKAEFIESVTQAELPQWLDFHASGWFAEVGANFKFKGKTELVKIFLSLEKENQGHKWVMKNVFFAPFGDIFYNDTSSVAKFLHPMSHELDFMNLVKVFKDNQDLVKYTAKEFQPDFLTLFLYEFKRGMLSFEGVQKVKFHFFQAENYYFQLEEFNRSGHNRGWLISDLTRLEPHEKDILLRYIYREK